jgi:hypothetical protein
MREVIKMLLYTFAFPIGWVSGSLYYNCVQSTDTSLLVAAATVIFCFVIGKMLSKKE